MGKLANTGICKTCHGAGNIATFGAVAGTEFWPCPACGGAGTRAVFSPPFVNRRVVIGKHGREVSA